MSSTFKGPLVELVDLAATRGVPGNFVREQLRCTGLNLDQMRAVLERLPKLGRLGYSVNAVAGFWQSLGVERLPFKLLPPGAWDVETVIGSYQNANKFANNWCPPRLDLGRLTALVSLGPTRCYLGTELWSWYVLFEFEAFGSSVLECPYEGNATYVILGEWASVVSHTKREIREEFSARCTKIVHKNEWLKRVSAALRRRPLSGQN
jgi:hypothetical protein